MKLVSCMCWVGQGQANLVPTKVRLPKEDLEKLIHGTEHILPTETSEGEDDQEEPTGKESGISKSEGLRGSASKHVETGESSSSEGSSSDSDEEQGGNSENRKRKRKSKSKPKPEVEDKEEEELEDSTDKKYKLDTYDKDEAGSEKEKPSMQGVACFVSPTDDPFLTGHEDSDEEEEKEDFVLKPDDNQLVIGRIKDDDYSLEVYVYNAAQKDFYVHHDYVLEAPPVCMTHIGYDPDPESRDGKGNLCAVGTMNPDIHIFDLNLVDTLDSVFVLGNSGRSKKSAKSTKKKKKESLSHSEAVLCLSWNGNMSHVLGSGSADHGVILWDLDACKGSTLLEGHEDNVQSLEWHPVESTLLLSGGCDGMVALWDCRTCEIQRKWTVTEGEEVEKVIWNPFNPFYFWVGTSKGTLNYYDSRKDNESFSEIHAHGGEITGICMNPSISSCVTTTGDDGCLKMWKLANDGLQLVGSKNFNLKDIRCHEFCPDSNKTLALGGTKGDYITLWSLDSLEEVKAAFKL